MRLDWYGGSLFENRMKLLELVATLQDIPEQQVMKGQVGTVIEELGDDHVLVEFAGLDGAAYAITPIPVGQLIQLKHSPVISPE